MTVPIPHVAHMLLQHHPCSVITQQSIEHVMRNGVTLLEKSYELLGHVSDSDTVHNVRRQLNQPTGTQWFPVRQPVMQASHDTKLTNELLVHAFQYWQCLYSPYPKVVAFCNHVFKHLQQVRGACST